MISPRPPYEFRPQPARDREPLATWIINRLQHHAWGQFLVPVYYAMLGPVSWAYLHGWISPDAWSWLNNNLLWPIEDVMQQTHGPIAPLLWAWQLWWER